VGAMTPCLKCSQEHTGNSDENAKNNSQYAHATGVERQRSATSIKIDRTKTQGRPRVSAQAESDQPRRSQEFKL